MGNKLGLKSNSKNSDNIVIAMYAYRAEHTDDLTFRKGEKLEVLERSDPDWWTVRRIKTGEIGYIPANYVASINIESEDWYYGCIGKREAENILQYSDYPAGTFLIRLSKYNTPNTLSMPQYEILDQVSQHKYRSPKPIGVECPDSYYDMMLKCWDEVPENRPTFEYLYHFFEDYFVVTETQLKSL
ncbi:unnamed protein product [Oppiella nova]|uniref:Tyrosine-protein kinase n=1 Tax=Oppiella nova TaxID=334625 RepID=A0A7R9M9Q9_9ACAR|nr:unnamed protein product [Oppiella nova]CAG2173420.1 unnamed protein product [Oppiella nova]